MPTPRRTSPRAATGATGPGAHHRVPARTTRARPRGLEGSAISRARTSSSSNQRPAVASRSVRFSVKKKAEPSDRSIAGSALRRTTTSRPKWARIVRPTSSTSVRSLLDARGRDQPVPVLDQQDPIAGSVRDHDMDLDTHVPEGIRCISSSPMSLLLRTQESRLGDLAPSSEPILRRTTGSGLRRR